MADRATRQGDASGVGGVDDRSTDWMLKTAYRRGGKRKGLVRRVWRPCTDNPVGPRLGACDFYHRLSQFRCSCDYDVGDARGNDGQTTTYRSPEVFCLMAIAGSPPTLGWGRLIVLILALLWLGGAVGYAVGVGGRGPDPDSADVGYLQDMISHHEQALKMSMLELSNGQESGVQVFAREILQFQSYEIGLMEARLRDWGYVRANRSDTAMAWMGMPTPVENMPGLATEEQMSRLREAQGVDADRLFLEMMAGHHRGGVDMGLAAAERASDQWVAELAARQAKNQIVEINELLLASDRLGLQADIEPYD